MVIFYSYVKLPEGIFFGEAPVEFYTAWWLTYPSQKYEFVNGKDDNPYVI